MRCSAASPVACRISAAEAAARSPSCARRQRSQRAARASRSRSSNLEGVRCRSASCHHHTHEHLMLQQTSVLRRHVQTANAGCLPGTQILAEADVNPFLVM